MSTLSLEKQNKITSFLKGRHIPVGLGSKEEACSVAAINLALTGKLTDKIPTCMSRVVGGWIIAVQDRMPDEMRNSEAWRALLPLAAGTGRVRDDDKRRRAIILAWMWEAMRQLQPLANKRGFGEAWKKMVLKKTPETAREANKAAADAAADAAAVAAADAAAYAAAAAAAVGAAKNWEQLKPIELLTKLVK